MFKLNSGVLALLSALTLAGCRGEDPGTSETDASTSGTTGAQNTTTGTPTTTTPTTTGDDGTTSGTTGTPTTTDGPEPTTDNSGNFLTTNTDSSGGDTGAQPNGGPCESDADCESMNCVSLLLGMVQFCGACNEDQDCVTAGTGTACTLSILNQGAMCTDGPPGSTCMSDEACMGEQFCENVLDTPILPNTCGDCAESADCDMDQICSPAIDFMMLSGKKSCVEPGSVPNNQLCPTNGEGAMACMSGHCTEASIMGFINMNICGECSTDADCPMPGQTCTPAEASMNGIMGSVCT